MCCHYEITILEKRCGATVSGYSRFCFKSIHTAIIALRAMMAVWKMNLQGFLSLNRLDKISTLVGESPPARTYLSSTTWNFGFFVQRRTLKKVSSAIIRMLTTLRTIRSTVAVGIPVSVEPGIAPFMILELATV